MPNNARVTDIAIGVCCCHPSCIPMVGVIVTGSPNTTSNNLAQARVSDIVIGGCGHVGIIIAGSPNVQCNNLSAARIGDPVVGCLIMTIATGSCNIITN
jgi:uncharacterized Zn-binding protein involved in type VI secretion